MNWPGRVVIERAAGLAMVGIVGIYLALLLDTFVSGGNRQLVVPVGAVEGRQPSLPPVVGAREIDESETAPGGYGRSGFASEYSSS